MSETTLCWPWSINSFPHSRQSTATVPALPHRPDVLTGKPGAPLPQGEVKGTVVKLETAKLQGMEYQMEIRKAKLQVILLNRLSSYQSRIFPRKLKKSHTSCI
jgi:hypothetical protein